MEGKRRDLPERTFEFARRVVRLCQVLDQAPGVSRVLAGQLLRAGTSIGANVEEGQASQSRADFLAKYSIAARRRAKPITGFAYSRPRNSFPMYGSAGFRMKPTSSSPS